MLANLQKIGVLLTLLVNVVVVVGFATSIQTKLDRIRSTSTSNCELLRTAIVLSIEQSAANRLLTPSELKTNGQALRTFQAVVCG